jgi:hypothetical protein
MRVFPAAGWGVGSGAGAASTAPLRGLVCEWFVVSERAVVGREEGATCVGLGCVLGGARVGVWGVWDCWVLERRR